MQASNNKINYTFIIDAFKSRRELKDYEELGPILIECLDQTPERRPSVF